MSKTKSKTVQRPRLQSGQSDIDRFLNLSAEDKERVFEEIDAKSPEELGAQSRPLNAEERHRLARFKRGLGRPRKGHGSKAINVTVELGLLRRADAYAQERGFTRPHLIARGLELAMKAAS